METFVETCPRNITEVLESSTKLSCGQDIYGNNQYICVPHTNKTELVQLCFRGVMKFIERGNCLETDGENLYYVDCLGFSSGCPDEDYQSNTIYQYPACQSINTEKQCFLAESSCPDISWSTATNNTSFDIQTTTPAPHYDPSYAAEIAGGLSAGVFILAVILIIAVVLWRRQKQQKNKEHEDTQCIYFKRKSIKCDEESRQGEIETLLPEETIKSKEQIGNSTQEEIDTNTQDHGGQDGKMDSIYPSELTRIVTHADDKGALAERLVGKYSAWKTKISDEFSTLTDDEVSVLFCFLCSDSGPPDFTDTEWLDMLNEIRERVYDKENPVTREEAQQTLNRLKSRDYLWEDQEKITEDTKDETMYRIALIDPLNNHIPFYYSSCDTASVYLRSCEYKRKPREKCVITPAFDSLLIRRLQMNILTHVTMEDTDISDEIHQILNIPKNIIEKNKDEREEFLTELRREGESVHYRRRSQDSVDHVTWLWRYEEYNRPDIVRSCIGLHPHNDIYIIDNKTYRKPSKIHCFPTTVRCLLYCLLISDKYRVIDQSHKIMKDKIRQRYFPDITADGPLDLPDEITETRDGMITFISDDIRHDVMYAFATDCLVEENDLEFFLTTASRDVVYEYCRLWDYERNEGERCLFIPEEPEKMYDLFIDKLQLDIITHCTMSDWGIHRRISERLGVPREVLRWDQEARERYVKYAKRGTQTVHHARGMIVGCAGAGKTTLLKRLLGCSEEEIKKVKSTEGLEVHEEIFHICEKNQSLRGKIKDRKICEKNGERESELSDKTLSFFDFGGQCAYYACHQIYLTRRAFYVVVMDASKRLDQVVDKEVCDQTDTVFSGWTYKEYFVFWLKSIHTYCSSVKQKSDEQVEVLIVATHWDKSLYKNKDSLLQSLYNALPNDSDTNQYIREDKCFLARFPADQPLADLEKCIIDITLNARWSEKIPHEWVFLNDEINEKSDNQPILSFNDLHGRLPVQKDAKIENAVDMLRYYHDAGKCLFFNEKGLQDSVIIDVQWFINAFKTIITDKLHVKGIHASKIDWKEYYETGNLKDTLLDGIWELEDKKSQVLERTDEIKRNNGHYLDHKTTLLTYMMRLGLIAVGKECHYVPSMNKKKFDITQKELIQTTESRTSVLVFRFDFLPFFLFYRLVVTLMQMNGLEVLRSKGTTCLYKNTAMFNCRDHYLAVAVTGNSIQLQMLHSETSGCLEKEITVAIRQGFDTILKNITNTFHKHLSYTVGFTCLEKKNQIIGMEIEDNFIEEEKLRTGTSMNCPLHQVDDRHKINPDYLSEFWK